MKRIIMTLCLFFVLLFGVACSEQSKSQKDPDISTVQADWPLLSLEELTNQADLIAFVKVTSAAGKEKNSGIQSRISTLDITETIAGSPVEEVALNQGTEYVKEGEDYLLFLRKDVPEGYYYILSPSGVIQEQDGFYITNRLGGGGTFTKEQIKRLVVNSLS